MKDIVKMLVDGEVAAPDDFRGCTEAEIQRLETHFDLHLPERYREFLRMMGRGAGEFFIGIDVFYSVLFKLKSWAEELLKECSTDFKLPEDAFVFSMHQGYAFQYFLISEGDDPPIYSYTEGCGVPELIANSFTDYLNDSAALHIQLVARIKELRSKREDR
jgi:hypothetical protein